MMKDNMDIVHEQEQKITDEISRLVYISMASQCIYIIKI